ncbi:hypothetical protein [Streptomyces griseoluteus]|uniref:hypothetical protein n=1 Tax=Streptomyces griseoluteus TaxID=29306 RepID=UPI0037F82D07
MTIVVAAAEASDQTAVAEKDKPTWHTTPQQSGKHGLPPVRVAVVDFSLLSEESPATGPPETAPQRASWALVPRQVVDRIG